jgi:hypothetical protein
MKSEFTGTLELTDEGRDLILGITKQTQVEVSLLLDGIHGTLLNEMRRRGWTWVLETPTIESKDIVGADVVYEVTAGMSLYRLGRRATKAQWDQELEAVYKALQNKSKKGVYKLE